MKYALKLLIGSFYLPFLILGGVIAIMRLLFTITFELSWGKGNDWYVYMLCKFNDFMQWLKK